MQDTDGDGRCDSAQVFSKGYNTILSGTGAGVLSYRDIVYFTCIPDVWMLRDANNDGVADVRAVMSSGYGVRFAFRGHDMHGLTIGPDGRLYFSIGDRGYNVNLSEGGTYTGGQLNDRLANPESGAVFRCELDGSNLEVVHTGLRNPQELAFDNEGNLFTGDNNSDSGDRARWVYVVPGGDSGWRMHYQYLPDRGPFNREHIWHPYHNESPAYIVPPITNLSDGPSGLAFYPGTGLGKKFDERFFLCDFRGQKSNSGIRTFRNQRQGAFFEVVEQEQSIWGILATDIQFGPDGRVYVSDWVHGWSGLDKGRIYSMSDASADQELVQQVQNYLSQGVEELDAERLVGLLSHADRRVRLEAQFELARRRDLKALANLLDATDVRLNRYAATHAIWALCQIVRRAPEAEALQAVAILRGFVEFVSQESVPSEFRFFPDPGIPNAGGYISSAAKIPSLGRIGTAPGGDGRRLARRRPAGCGFAHFGCQAAICRRVW